MARLTRLVRDGADKRLGTRKGDDPMPLAHSEECKVSSGGWSAMFGDGRMPVLCVEAGERVRRASGSVAGLLDATIELTVAEARALAAQLMASADAAERGT